MNLLIVTSHLPYPLSSGGNQAQFHFIEYLRDKIDISIIFNVNRVNNKNALFALKQKWINVSFYPYDWKKQTDRKEVLVSKLYRKLQKKLVKNVFCESDILPFEELTDCFLSHVESVIKRKSIDIVQIDFTTYLPLVTILPLDVKKVFVQHEIQYVRNKLLLSQMERISDKQRLVCSVQRNEEIAMMNKCDCVVTLTEVDKKKLECDGVEVKVVSSPACVSSTDVHVQFIPTDRKLVFIGGSGHYPNYQGLLWFLSRIWNKILIKLPDAQLNIIGKWKDNQVEEILDKYPQIYFKGFVDDLKDALQSSIMIVPILIGSGMRMKIVEAANYGVPFISTTVGVEGLNFKDGEECLIEDDESLFADKIIGLLNNAEQQKIFSQRVREKYEKEYSLEVLGKRRFDILKAVVDGEN